MMLAVAAATAATIGLRYSVTRRIEDLGAAEV